MTAAERAYTSEYYYVPPSSYAEDFARQLPARSRQYSEDRTGRDGSQVNRRIEPLPQTQRQKGMTRAALFRSVVLLIIIGMLLIASVWTNAKAADIKYSINQINKASMSIEDEIDMLRIRIEGANGIESVEECAVKKMGMGYPRADQCIYIAEDAAVQPDLVKIIKEKAYE